MSNVIDAENFAPEQEAMVLSVGLERAVMRVWRFNKANPDRLICIYQQLADARDMLGVITGELLNYEQDRKALKELYERGQFKQENI